MENSNNGKGGSLQTTAFPYFSYLVFVSFHFLILLCELLGQLPVLAVQHIPHHFVNES